jgi:hypothetical protein
MKMVGAPSRPQWRTWVRKPRTVRNSERDGFMSAPGKGNVRPFELYGLVELAAAIQADGVK